MTVMPKLADLVDKSFDPFVVEKLAHGDAKDPYAVQQALNVVQKSSIIACDSSELRVQAHTICIHGDTPAAPIIAAAVAYTLRKAAISLHALSRR